jgi:hypothetical protein
MTSINKANTVLIVESLAKASKNTLFQGRWWSDEALVKAFLARFKLKGLCTDNSTRSLSQFNKAISQAPRYSLIDNSFPMNSSGIFRMQMRVKCTTDKFNTRYFYYFSKDLQQGPSLLTVQKAQEAYNNDLRSSPRNKRHRTENDSEIENELEEVLEPVVAAVPTYNYWSSQTAINLFHPESGEAVAVSLHNKIDVCQTRVSATVLGSKLSFKYLLLKKAYELALINMPTTLTWNEWCKKAITILNDAGLTTINNSETILRWNRYFRIYGFLEMDPKTKAAKVFVPELFKLYPEAKALINAQFAKDIENISAENFRNYVLDDLIPQIIESENNTNEGEEPLTKETLLNAINIKTFSLSTAYKYLSFLGFKYDDQKKTYYNDGHERLENVEYRKKFILEYFKHELSSYLWVQVPEVDAVLLEKLETNPLMKDASLFCLKDNIPCREYHVDCHPELKKYVNPENISFGGNRSVRSNHQRPLIIIGQDESAYSQYRFSSKSWKGPNGESKLLPKSDGETIMCSAFSCRGFGLGRTLTKEEIVAINMKRTETRPLYLSVESSTYLTGNTEKQPIKDNSPFVRFFEVGVEKEGFWSYNHMALQTEDLVDCLQVLYPAHDILFLFDQSSGHAKKRQDGLNVVDMNLYWGGSQKKKRDTIIEEGCLGQYNSILKIGDTQQLTYADDDDGPFHLKPDEQILRKYDKVVGRVNKPKTKSEILQELIDSSNFTMAKHYTKEELEALAKHHKLTLLREVDKKEEGWHGKPKGILQILFERGHINEEISLSEYTLDGKKSHKDENGEVLKQYLPFCLRHVLSQCRDFQNEVTAMEDLAAQLSTDICTVHILYTPKYHCEIAGEGIEYAWGLSKKYYRNLPLNKKKGLANFRKSVRDSVSYVTVDHVRQFSGLARRYMLAYNFFDNRDNDNQDNDNITSAQPSYDEIERFVKKTSKTHRNVLDNDTSNINRVFKEALNLP